MLCKSEEGTGNKSFWEPQTSVLVHCPQLYFGLVQKVEHEAQDEARPAACDLRLICCACEVALLLFFVVNLIMRQDSVGVEFRRASTTERRTGQESMLYVPCVMPGMQTPSGLASSSMLRTRCEMWSLRR